MKRFLISALLSLATSWSNSAQAAIPLGGFTSRPKLIVLIAVDQLRGDFLTRLAPRFLGAKGAHGLGGYRYLMNNGAYFPSAQYTHLQNMTGPGHATMLTGALPYQAGIPLNYWFDTTLKRKFYCAEDVTQALVPPALEGVKSGTSPKNLLADTVGDVLKTTGYPTRVVSLALKDRSAIFMGGHQADLALWFEPKSFQWVSSRFYLPEGQLPEWISKLNKSMDPAKAKLGKKALIGVYGNEITMEAARQAVIQYKMGSGKATDLMAVSLSAHDYVGHLVGPNSPELDLMTLDEDRHLSQFFNFLQKTVPGGMKNVVVVLTSDHGIPPKPDVLKNKRSPSGYVNEEKIAQRLNDVLVEKWGKPADGKWIAYAEEFNFYFNTKSLESENISAEKAQNELKSLLQKEDWVAFAFTAGDVINRRLPPGKLERQILATYRADRSGHVIAIPKPYYMPDEDTVTHLTGYSYDSTVPLLFSGPNIKPATRSGGEIIDIAPTLSFLLGVVPPAMSEGKVLDIF